MWKYLVITFLSLIYYGSFQNDDECYCVRYYLCRNKTIITDGNGIIDPRLGEKKCNRREVCCKLIYEPPTPETTTTSQDQRKHKKCGIRNPDGVGFRIVANEKNNETEFGEFPWMVGILLKDETYQCGGSLIHPSVVLTAAHCVTESHEYIIRAGEWDSSSPISVIPKQERKVESVIIHDEYTPGPYYNDIALLFLKSPFNLKKHIKVACLPSKNAVIDNARCFVTGWGKNSFGQEGQFPPILKEVQLPMVPRDTCQQNLRKTRLGTHFRLHRSFVCAGGELGRDACIGDGGGPLVCPIEGQEETYQQVGVVAWGIGCGQQDIPGVYSNVAYFREWIDKQLKDNNFDLSEYE